MCSPVPCDASECGWVKLSSSPYNLRWRLRHRAHTAKKNKKQKPKQNNLQEKMILWHKWPCLQTMCVTCVTLYSTLIHTSLVRTLYKVFYLRHLKQNCRIIKLLLFSIRNVSWNWTRLNIFALLPFLPSGHMKYCSQNALQLHKHEHFPLRLASLNVPH